MNTVNVIDMPYPPQVQHLVSYPDDQEGNKQAEETFVKWIKSVKPEIEEGEVEFFLEEGSFEFGEGYILLVHSLPVGAVRLNEVSPSQS